MASERQRSRCCERLERLGDSTLDREALQLEAIGVLRRVIGFDRWCWPLADPETLMPLAGPAQHDYGPQVARALELEYSGRDFAAMDAVARRARPVGSLSAETRRDLARSPRWDEVLRPVGIGDEAVVAFRDVQGCWGWMKAYRDSEDARFGEDDLELLAQVAPMLGAALRRRLEAECGDDVTASSAPGVVVLDEQLRPVSWTAAVRGWIDAFPASAMFAAWGILPPVIYPVAALARSGRGASGTHALERAVDGRWVKIEAAVLEGDDAGKTTVTLRRAAPAETFDLLCRAYALTRRERELVAALRAGLDTRALTERLFISRHTVQDHLKSVFRKVGVGSRRELLARFGDAPGELSL